MTSIDTQGRILAMLLAGAATLFATGAAAQTAETADSGETIIVTARKQAETVLDVPVSVSALSGSDLRDRQVSSATELAQFTPGLAMNQSFGRGGDRPPAARG